MTSYDTIIQRFLRRLEKDRKFFNYDGLDDAQAMAIAVERSKGYLYEATAMFILKCHPSVNFSNFDDENERFNFDLTPIEIFIISSLMYIQYMQRDIAYFKTLSVNYTSTSLRVLDPSNARTSFMNMYNAFKNEVEEYCDVYRNTDRNTGDFVSISFDQYDEE